MDREPSVVTLKTDAFDATRPTGPSAWRQLISNRGALIGLVLLLVVVIAAIAAPWIAPYPPEGQHLPQRLSPPSWDTEQEPTFLLGSDTLGRDVLSRILYGARVSLFVGVVAVLISGGIGVVLGLVAGYFQGWVDHVLSTFADIQQSIPFIALIIAVAAAIGPGLRNVILILGVTGWVAYFRVIRAEVFSVRERDFIEASRALGTSNIVIIWRHILPNVASSILVIATLLLASMITTEAARGW